jgi:hypothetical protein
VQFAEVVTYYYPFAASAEAQMDFIDADALQQAARLAGRRRPPKQLATLSGALIESRTYPNRPKAREGQTHHKLTNETSVSRVASNAC